MMRLPLGDTSFQGIIDKKRFMPYLNVKWIGNARSALGLGEYRGPSLLREDFETIAQDVALGVSPEFRFQHVIGTVGLRLIDDVL
ncbi:hypothetical protein, partial [Bradyrhizobium sp.]|uniref:hypothetical protein n=1 Tax=Bradyrhizobium sp. TaxID=376 RepID=UPI003C77F32E